MRLACLVTAAGSGSRFGMDKLMLPVSGQPMGVHALNTLHLDNFALRVLITSKDKGYLMDAAKERGFEVVINPAPERGMSSSVRLGTEHILTTGEYDGILYAVADQPNLSASTVEKLIDAFEREPACIWAPEAEGKRGNPVIFPASLFPELVQISGDKGGRRVIAAHRDLLRTVQVPAWELKDIDRKEDMGPC
ncbi:MAG: nucleotidyltransferase family protein [Clostridia bacterium]|nr:nucleotidyltransferase family protein [Clostridia bacterium]MBQ3651360.1 nucleotidyltransferase family protein [Clostridia bacterium]MBR0421399.1 nucleotidyltransferase family protein [Clostridia bacterium]